MGIHRNVIHLRFGNLILLGTVLIGAEASAYDQPISYNPCLECKLCVAFLASDPASYITGVELNIDGGMGQL